MQRDTPAEAFRRLLQLALAQERRHAFIALDPEGVVVEWAGGASRVFGYAAEEMIGRTLDCLMTGGEVLRGEGEWGLAVARSYGYSEEDRWSVRKDGVRVWTCSVTSALHDAAGDLVGFARVVRDRTDLRSQLESVQQRLALAQAGEQHRPVVLGILAHELRNPLGEIVNAARVVRRIAPPDEDLRASLQVIERQVRFIDNLVQDLLESTRLAVGKAKLHCETIELRRLVDEAVESCQGAFDARRQVLETVVPAAAPVEVDAVRMRQVIVNLLGNSSKFSPAGGRVWLKANIEAGELVIRVEDRGRGIPADVLPRIFELFTQAGPEGQRAGHGLGLGLGVVKALVEMHGGTVQARSEGSDRGAEIIVRVPARRPAGEGT